MSRPIYAIHLLLDGSDVYLLQDLDGDGDFIRDTAGRVRRFSSQADRDIYADRAGFTVDKDIPDRIDLDAVTYWVSETRVTAVDCNLFLVVWNLFADIAAALKNPPVDLKAPRILHLYHKLFWGSNQPVIVDPAEQYKPVWTEDELADLRHVLSCGLALLQ